MADLFDIDLGPEEDSLIPFDAPCDRPDDGGHRCRVGGGAAGLSDDHGHSWFCRLHSPLSFWTCGDAER